MKKTTRMMAFLLALVMLLALTACQSPEKKPAGTETPKTTEATKATEAPHATEAPEVEPVEIEFWHQQQTTMGGTLITELVNEFNANNEKGITVKEVTFADYGQLMTAMQAAMAADIFPALAAVDYAKLNYLATNTPYVSPKDIIENYFPEDKDYLNTKYESAILELGVAIDGELVGLPYGLSVPVMYYNLDILEAAGLDTENLPETWQEVRTYAETVVDKTDKNGVYIQMPNGTFCIVPLFHAAGVDDLYVVDGDGYKATFNTPKAVEVWIFIQEMYQNGSAVYMTNTEGLAAFAGGEIAMLLTTSARLSGLMETDLITLDTYVHPKWEGTELGVCLGGNMLTMFGQDEAQQKAAWEFTKFLLEADNMGAFATITGYVPPTNDVTEAEWEAMTNPLIQKVIGQKSAARTWTSWPGAAGAQVDLVLVSMRDKICVDMVDVATAIADTEKQINEMINE